MPEEFLGFGETVGDSPNSVKVPHVKPTTDTQHEQNMVELERQINRIRLGTKHFYSNPKDPATPFLPLALTLPGDNTLTRLRRVRFPAGFVHIELSLYFEGTASITGIATDIQNGGLPIYAYSMPNSYTDLTGTNQGESYTSAIYHFTSSQAVDFMAAVTTADNSDADLVWSILTTPVTAYLE